MTKKPLIYIMYEMEIVSKYVVHGFIKNFSYIVVALVSLGLQSYSILGVFMIVDTITGVIRSGTIHGWRSVTSHAATVGITAKCLVILVPLLIAIAGHGVGLELGFIARSALKVLILSELYSILSNIQSIRLKREVQEFDAVNYILNRLRDFLEKSIKRPHTDGK